MRALYSLLNKKIEYLPNNYYSFILIIKKLLKTNKLKNKTLNILDFGCGRGNLLKVIKNSNIDSNLYGVDIYKDSEKYQKVRDLLPFAKIKSIKPYEEFDFNQKFDIIVSNMVFEHIENLDLVYKHLKNTLSKNGFIVAAFPTKEIIIEPHLNIPFVHLMNKNSRLLYKYLELFSIINLGQFKQTKGKSFKVKKNYLENRYHYCNKNIFYLPYVKHLDLIKKNFEKTIDISDLALNFFRNYSTFSNKIKFMISLFPIKKFRLFLFRRFFGTFLIFSR